MSFYSPWGLLALLGVPVIIILYILKQRHTDYSISSLYLWQHAVADLEANAPWQKLKKNILMLLQILGVVLLSLIMSGPVVRTGGNQDKAVLLVLDMSLGMQATDIKPSRFEAAKKDMAELVSSCGPGTKFSIVASGRNPYIVQRMVDDKHKTLQEIKELSVTDCIADMDGTFELVDSLARENPEMKIYWFGDEQNPFSDDRIKYYLYGADGVNYAVTMLSHRKFENNPEVTVLSRIANFSGQDAELDVSLYIDSEFFEAQRVKVGANGSESLYWKGIPKSAEVIECRIDTQDILQKDNRSVLQIYPDKTSKVLLATESNLFMEKVLSLMPDIELYRTAPDDIGERKGFDIYIFDGNMPERLPEDGHVILFAPPESEYFTIAGRTEHTTVKTSDHDFFNDLQRDMSFGAMKTDLYTLPRWGSPLMQTEKGVAAFEGYLGKNRLMVFGFDLHQTNLPVKPFFPILMTRVINTLTPGNMQSLSSVYAGDTIELPVDPEAGEIYVTTPGGNKSRVAPPFPAPAYDDTFEAGMYTLQQYIKDGTIETKFFVNAPSEKEFTSSSGVMTGSNGQRSAKRATPGGWSLQSVLLWLLLITLLVEWWVYTNGHTI